MEIHHLMPVKFVHLAVLHAMDKALLTVLHAQTILYYLRVVLEMLEFAKVIINNKY